MKNKKEKDAYVKIETENKEENLKQPANELQITEQLEIFAAIIIDHYFESAYEEKNSLKE
jgi:hypothetical protein